jgi:hypothetical protein
MHDAQKWLSLGKFFVLVVFKVICKYFKKPGPILANYILTEKRSLASYSAGRFADM